MVFLCAKRRRRALEKSKIWPCLMNENGINEANHVRLEKLGSSIYDGRIRS